MKGNKWIWITLLNLMAITFQANGQHFLKAEGKIIVNENQDTILLRGMGLGGWMVQEGYMLQTASFANPQHKIRNKIEELIGTEDTDLFYEAWLANHVRQADIDSLKSWGFNSVRLPMHYNLYTLPIEDEPVAGQNTWLTKGFELTDSLISWCKQNEMYVILDLHAAPGGQGYDEGISDYDTSKPSLWESQENRDKMVALWKNLAERYADEQWVAGYDLLNEANWNLPGGTALKNLYLEITDSIRTVDTKHILFIEGNWFANDFTGLTPPWDDNMVYSPHKYWSVNDQASIQWVLDIRNTYDIPLYLGESGENSNVWFRDAIRLLEDNNIGWAWWPMKKIESIAGPLSVIKTEAYQSLLDYWNGTGSMPSPAVAKETLMQITEGLKIENCIYQKDVIDAMFRQVYSTETIPYNTQDIPGVVYPTDFDMGVLGKAYYDTEVANYQVTTGNYTSWNNGWAYRNDGVDIQASSDNVNSNGYNIGWLETGEWMLYDVNVANTAVYEVKVRVASGINGGRFHFGVGDADISKPYQTSGTNGWQNWETVVIPNVILDASDKKLKFYMDEGGFNLGSFEFIETGATTAIPTEFVAAGTTGEQTVQMNTNKILTTPLPAAPAGFEISVDGNTIPITSITIDPDNSRIIHFTLDHIFDFRQSIKISYAGDQVLATDGTVLKDFTLENVVNNLPSFYQVPGRVEAEGYFFQSGVQLENTSDAGGGQNIGFLDPGDYLDYEIDVATSGTYQVDYRTASETSDGTIELQLIDDEQNPIVLHSPTFPLTGGWQSWTTSSESLELSAGRHKIRMLIKQAPFNVNWFEFFLTTTSTEAPESESFTKVKVFPNPSNSVFNLEAELTKVQHVQIAVFNVNNQLIYTKSLGKVAALHETIPLAPFPNGFYSLVIQLEDGTIYADKLIKTDN